MDMDSILNNSNCEKCGKPYTYYNHTWFLNIEHEDWCPECRDKYKEKYEREEKRHQIKKRKEWSCSSCNGTGKIKGYTCVRCNGEGHGIKEYYETDPNWKFKE